MSVWQSAPMVVGTVVVSAVAGRYVVPGVAGPGIGLRDAPGASLGTRVLGV